VIVSDHGTELIMAMIIL